MHYRLWVERGATTDFLIRLIRLADGKETDVLRFDCCHGEVHVHRRYRNASETRKVILAIETQEHVEAGLQLAEDMLGKESELIRMGWDS